MERSMLETRTSYTGGWQPHVVLPHAGSTWQRPALRTATPPARPGQGAQGNELLSWVPPPVLAAWGAQLESVELSRQTLLHEPGRHIAHVYFPVSSVVSLQHHTRDGGCCEIAMIGAEGLVGIGQFMGNTTCAHQAVVQRSGRAWRLPAHALQSAFSDHAALRPLMLRYTQALFAQIAQTAVCNRHHPVAQQLCRWLLLSLDRSASADLAVTQEQIAHLLGVRRESVSEEIGRLRERHAVHTGRGHITVLDRQLLERGACECYAVVRLESERLRPRQAA